MAQTTVTSNGRVGRTACLDQPEVGATSLSLTEIKADSIRYTTSRISWNQYVGRLGDMTPPNSIEIFIEVYNARTETSASRIRSATVTAGNTYLGNSSPYVLGSLSAKTVYYIELYAAPSGSVPKQVFARRCFMTGGTYTMNVDPNSTQGRNSGCFTVSPLTIQHVRNCWCGRKTTLPLFSSTQENTDFLNRWGCQ